MKRYGLTKYYNKHIMLCIMIILMSEIVSLLCVRNLLTGFIFSLFQIFGVLLPGTAILLLTGHDKVVGWRQCAFSYIIGYGFSLFEYFFIMISGLRRYAVYVFLLIACLSVICVYMKTELTDESQPENESVSQKIILIFTAIMFAMMLFCGNLNNLIPPVVQSNSPGTDMLYWVGDIIELSKEFPPKTFFYYTFTEYKYHYFSTAQLALIRLVTNISPLHLGLFFSAVQSVLLRIFCGYIVVGKCTSVVKDQILGMLLLFFSSGFEYTALFSYSFHSYHGPSGTEYGLAGFLVMIYLLLVKNEEEKNELRTSIFVWLCIFITAGLKVSFGAVSLAGLGVLCIGWLIKGRYAKAFITGLPSLGIFILEYRYILGMSRYVNNEASSWGTGPVFKTYMSYMYEKIAGIFPMPQFLAILLFLLVYAILISPVSVFSVIYNTVTLTKNKNWDVMDASFLAMYGTGMLVTSFVTMYGLSNMYFAMACIPAAVIWLIKRGEPQKLILRCLFIVSVAVSVIGFVKGNNEDSFATVEFFEKSISLLTKGVDENSYYEYSFVDMEEYKAYEWLKDNSDEEDIVAINRISRVPGAFSERYTCDIRFENSVFTKTTDEEMAWALDDYKETGVKYIIYDKKYDEVSERYEVEGWSDEYLNENCDVAYQSDNITIYRII